MLEKENKAKAQLGSKIKLKLDFILSDGGGVYCLFHHQANYSLNKRKQFGMSFSLNLQRSLECKQIHLCWERKSQMKISLDACCSLLPQLWAGITSIRVPTMFLSSHGELHLVLSFLGERAAMFRVNKQIFRKRSFPETFLPLNTSLSSK